MAETFEVIQEVTVDVSKNIPAPTVFCKQADNVVRVLRVTIQDNKEDYTIPAGFAARLRGTKADGTRIYLDARSAAGNVAEFVLTQNALAADGKATCEVELSNSDGDVVKSCNLILNVQKSAMDDSAVESTDEFQSLDVAVKDAQNAKTAAEKASTAAAASATKAAESETAAKNAAKDASDVKASIHADYSQMSATVSQLKEDTDALKDGKISKFYASSQGATNLPDSDDGRIMDLKLYGKSEQKQYSGKNLWNMHQALTIGNVAIEGTKYVATANTMQIDVTPDSTAARPMKISAGEAYTLSMKTTVALGKGRFFCVEYVDGTRYNYPFENSNSVVFTPEIDMSHIGLVIYETSNGDTVWDVQLEKGSTATDYEPYVGGIPSPSPEYPQEIKSVVNPVVKVMGKNLLSELYLTTKTKLGITVSSAGQGKIAVKGTATGEANFDYWGQNFWIPKGANILCKILQGSGSNKNSVTFFGPNFIGGLYTRFGEISSRVVSTGYKCGMVRVSIKSGESVDCTLGLSLQMDTSTDYEPYTEQTATLPYTLNAIPVSSGGNVTIDGQQYVADYVDVERGKLVRMCSLVDAKSFTWDYDRGWSGDGYYSYDAVISNAFWNGRRGYVKSSICEEKPRSEYSSALRNTIMVAGAGNNVEFVGVSQNSLQSWKEYINANKVDILYALATPTETDLTADEIAAFKSLVSYYPVTNVSTTSDQLDGYTVFNYPISLANGWNYVKQQLGDTRDYLYGIDLMTAEAYVNSEYAAALAEIEV